MRSGGVPYKHRVVALLTRLLQAPELFTESDPPPLELLGGITTLVKERCEEHAVALHRRCCGPEATPFTLEDLGALAQLLQADGKPAGGCAFFSSRVLLGNAELIFAPYSYVIDGDVGGLKMRELLEDSLLIFDEAHNVEDAAREAGSIELPGHEAANLLRLLEKLRGLCSSD